MPTVCGGSISAASPGQSSSPLSTDPSQCLQPKGHEKNQNGCEQLPAESVTTAALVLEGLSQENQHQRNQLPSFKPYH